MNTHPVFNKQRIFAPGPTPVPHEVLATMSAPPMHHRTKGFEAVLEKARDGLKYLYQTKQPVHLFAASGSGAMEAAITNLFSVEDEILTINCGKFGERWGKIGRKYGLKVHEHMVEWGNPVDPDEIKTLLKQNPNIQGVCFQASETSTGIKNPVKEIAEVVKSNSDALIVVDAVTALGVFDVQMDEWGLDAVVTGSQKALMLPPGLAFLGVSERANQRRIKSNIPNFYFDLAAEEKALGTKQTAWTPAVSLICGLEEVLSHMKSAGLENIFKYHEQLATATRAGATAMGLKVFAKSSPSPAVTAIEIPDSLANGSKIVGLLRDEFGISIVGGQDHLKGKIFRIGHLGFYDKLDVLTIMSAVEMGLKQLGHNVELGTGAGAAARSFMESK